MESGYGFGAEGDWKTAALLRTIKIMEVGLPGGTSFMEDYTYHLEPGNELVLGAHMLEVDPSIAEGHVRIDVQPLGIGGKADPARMVFEGRAGRAICASLVAMGGRMRLIVADVEAVKPIHPMPKLPVARVMWSPLPDFSTGVKAWIYAGGAHHSVMSYSVTADMLARLGGHGGHRIRTYRNKHRTGMPSGAIWRSPTSYGVRGKDMLKSLKQEVCAANLRLVSLGFGAVHLGQRERT